MSCKGNGEYILSRQSKGIKQLYDLYSSSSCRVRLSAVPITGDIEEGWIACVKGCRTKLAAMGNETDSKAGNGGD